MELSASRGYTYDDDEGKGKAYRPDITFHTTPPLATDITVVSPQYIVDQAASVAATMKVKKGCCRNDNPATCWYPNVLLAMSSCGWGMV